MHFFVKNHTDKLLKGSTAAADNFVSFAVELEPKFCPGCLVFRFLCHTQLDTHTHTHTHTNTPGRTALKQ
jgi:hypothetical protein